jgi:hypothetical protein
VARAGWLVGKKNGRTDRGAKTAGSPELQMAEFRTPELRSVLPNARRAARLSAPAHQAQPRGCERRQHAGGRLWNGPKLHVEIAGWRFADPLAISNEIAVRSPALSVIGCGKMITLRRVARSAGALLDDSWITAERSGVR